MTSVRGGTLVLAIRDRRAVRWCNVTEANIPSIETDRLILRRHRAEDLRELAAMWGNPQMTYFIVPKPFPVEAVWMMLLRHIGQWSALGFGYWIIRDKITNRFIGEVGFADFMREMEQGFGGVPELGWSIEPTSQCKGFATEAVRAALSWGAITRISPRTVCLSHPENRASLRVAEKCNFVERCRTTYAGGPSIIFDRSLGAG